jgi:Der1-like family
MRRRHGGGRLRNAFVIYQFAPAVVAPYISSYRRQCSCPRLLLTISQMTAGYFLQCGINMAALMLAFIYTFAQDNRGKKAHFIILQIPVEFLPWAMLTLTFIMGGPYAAMQQGMGLIAAHLYDFLTRLYPSFQGGRNYIQTPNAIKRYFGADQSAFTHKAHGTSFRPAQNIPQQQSRGWTSGFSGAWSGRGQGRRLGGD